MLCRKAQELLQLTLAGYLFCKVASVWWRGRQDLTNVTWLPCKGTKDFDTGCSPRPYYARMLEFARIPDSVYEAFGCSLEGFNGDYGVKTFMYGFTNHTNVATPIDAFIALQKARCMP